MRHLDGTKVTTDEMVAIAVEMGHDEADLRNRMNAFHKEALARGLVLRVVQGELLRRKEFALFTATPANHPDFAGAFRARFGRDPEAAD